MANVVRGQGRRDVAGAMMWRPGQSGRRRRATVPGALCICVLLASLSPTQVATAQDSTPAIERRIYPSLALVVTLLEGGQLAKGTAFCFWSTRQKSYFLTDYHVVDGARGVFLALERDRAAGSGRFPSLIRARYFPTRMTPRPDLAVLVIDQGGVPPLSFRPGRPPIGQEIGIAGYPYVRYLRADNDLGRVTPSVQYGHVNDTGDKSGDFFEYDAKTDHGNSGGPVFEWRTGVVLGIVDEGEHGYPAPRPYAAPQYYFAESSNLIFSFLILGSYLPVWDARNGAATVPCALPGQAASAQCRLPDSVLSR